MATKDPRKAIKLHVQCTLYTHINWLVSIMQLCSPGILSLDSINCHLQNDKVDVTTPHTPLTVLCCTVLYCAVLYCTVLCCTVLYCPHPCWCPPPPGGGGCREGGGGGWGGGRAGLGRGGVAGRGRGCHAPSTHCKHTGHLL